jgi:hypothetical protein
MLKTTAQGCRNIPKHRRSGLQHPLFWTYFVVAFYNSVVQQHRSILGCQRDIELFSNVALLYITSDYWRCCWRLSSPWWWVARRGPTRSHLHPRYSYIDTDSTLSGHVAEIARINSNEMKHLRSILPPRAANKRKAELRIALHM